MYRILLAGAVLARAHMAPLFRAKEVGKKHFLVRWSDSDYKYIHWEETDPIHVPYIKSESKAAKDSEDIDCIRQCAVYNYDVPDSTPVGEWRNQEDETCFGPFVSWIVEDGRKRQQNEPFDPTYTEPEWAQHPADVGAVSELMLLTVAYDHFIAKFENDSWDSAGREYACDEKPAHLRGNRTVSVVRLGIFQIEQVTMPTACDHHLTRYLFTDFHPAFKGSVGEDIPWQFDMQDDVSKLNDERRDARPWPLSRENPGPPAMLELWHFALRRYLNLGFKLGTFWVPGKRQYEESVWWREVGKGEIFVNPNWSPVQKYRAGLVSWDQ